MVIVATVSTSYAGLCSLSSVALRDIIIDVSFPPKPKELHITLSICFSVTSSMGLTHSASALLKPMFAGIIPLRMAKMHMTVSIPPDALVV